MKSLICLGIRGIPAQHGGFETFAEYLARHLAARDWKVTVYCQEEGQGETYQSEWQGIQRIHIPVRGNGPLGTIIFDFKSILHSLRYNGIFLTLGYNTAVFNIFYRLKDKYNIINMDGIEWKRQKWGRITKTWFWLNEWLGCWFGNHLVADHPCIVDHLSSRVSRKKITMIPYGAREIVHSNEVILKSYDLKRNNYAIIIARAEPENSIFEIVNTFSTHTRGAKLVVLGNYDPQNNPYHRKILDAASNEVIFLGAIYDSSTVSALRFFARFYIHGHQVGGTNPSLVEALGAGNAILAHDNRFNRWVAGDGAHYFADEDACVRELDRLLSDNDEIDRMRIASRQRFQEAFTWDQVLGQYEKLFLDWLDR